MGYAIKITPRAEREAIIKKRLESADQKEDFHAFRDKTTELKRIRVAIDLPVYRMENFRTYTDQREIIAKEKLDSDYFAKGQELQTVQQKQHDILAQLASKGTGKVTPVIEVLKKDGQQERLLISASGVVINGNRRLAALRELGEPYVDCLVLPADATADEIVDIEAALQGKPDTKLDYDWIGDAQLINRLMLMHGSAKEVASRLNRTETEIKNVLSAFTEADIYLRDWAEAPEEYSRIKEDAEQLFKDLPKLLQAKDQALQQGSRAIAYSLFENRDKLNTRLYNFNAAIGKLADDVLQRLAETLEVPITASGDEVDDLAVDFSDENEIDYTALIERLKDDETKEETIEALVEACQSAIDAQAGKKSSKAALKAITQAHSKLVSVDLSTAGPETRPGMKKQLEAIAALVERLQAKLKAQND